jgi:prepilin-type N-terminal cleavage/methylation domain-containing protein
MRISIRPSRRAAQVAAQTTGSRKGFVLVEVIVAMVLLAVAVSSLAALVWSVSHSGLKTTGDAYRNGVLMQEVNRLEGIPYDSIPNGSYSVTVSTGTYPHTRVVTVSEPTANVIKSIRVVLTPANPLYKPDTVSFIRTKARTSKVLCTDCPELNNQ